MFERNNSASFRASMRSLLLPSLSKAFRRGLHHQQLGDVRLDQVIQPGSPRTFFQRHVQTSAQTFQKIQNGAGLGFDRTFHHQLAQPFRTAIVIASLCTSIPIYFTLSIEGAPF